MPGSLPSGLKTRNIRLFSVLARFVSISVLLVPVLVGTGTALSSPPLAAPSSGIVSDAVPVLPDAGPPTLSPAECHLTISGNFPPGEVGVAYHGDAHASGGTINYAIRKSTGSVPPGLVETSMSSIMGSYYSLSGTPTTAGTSYFKLWALDSNGCAGESQEYTVIIYEPLPEIHGDIWMRVNGTAPDHLFNYYLAGPNSGAARDTVVEGGNFPPYMPLEIHVTSDQGDVFPTIAVTTDGNGHFYKHILVWVSELQVQVWVVVPAGSGQSQGQVSPPTVPLFQGSWNVRNDWVPNHYEFLPLTLSSAD